jgi:hypothetical protein
VVECVLAKDETGVRFSLAAPVLLSPQGNLSGLSFEEHKDASIFMFLLTRARGEMDITAVFGTAVLGSNPGGRTKEVQYT